jgi:glycosyltransferase involved in cell wall biosynthesis
MLYVFPPVEDFGIMPVEAMALGTPVLVNPVGGAIESVRLLDGGSTLPDGSSSDIQVSTQMALSKDMKHAKRDAVLLSESAFMSKILSWKAGKPREELSAPQGGIHEDA